MAFIETIPPTEATGPLLREYDAAVRRAGRVYQILQIQSLKPATLHASMDLYMATMHAPSRVTRAERELLATVVSATNGCHY